MVKENDFFGLDKVYFEIHRIGERVVVIPSALITKDLLINFRKAHEKMDEIKKLVSNDPNIHNELKKRLISDLYDIQVLTKFWEETNAK